jgi:mannose-1-phosphate guanylyltransferase
MNQPNYGEVKAILLAAGLGTRLRPLTDTTPKCLLPVRGKPLLQYWFENLVAAGVPEVLVNTHWLDEHVDAFVAGRESRQLKITTFREPILLGTAGTILANRAWWSNASEVLIIYADNFTNVRIADILRFHRSHDLPFTLGAFETEEPHRCGIVDLDQAGTVVDFVEKPQNPRTNLAAAGLYVADPVLLNQVLARDAKSGGTYDLGRHVLPQLVGRMRAYHLQGAFLDIGTPESYRQAQLIAARMSP